MAAPSPAVLVIIGSGPGIGRATASLFAARKFSRIALIARDAERLQEDKRAIAKAAGREVEIQTWTQDVGVTQSFEATLQKVQEMGRVSCVLYNPARVGMSELFNFPEEELIADFMTTNVGLLTVAKWAIPLLRAQEPEKPSLLVTGSLLWADPIPQMFALSMVKAAQRNLVLSLQKTLADVHIALLSVGGAVSDDQEYLNAATIAEKFWQLYSQEREEWTGELEVLGA